MRANDNSRDLADGEAAFLAGLLGALTGLGGDLVTLLPLGGDAEGVRTEGLRYALDDETLAGGRTRGLSNEVVEPPASVSLKRGMLLIIETRKEPTP